MQEPQAYRERAAQCRRMADDARDEFHKQNWIMLAEYWSNFAEITEKHSPRRNTTNGSGSEESR